MRMRSSYKIMSRCSFDDYYLHRYIEETFDNWGSTLLANVTVRTFFPRTVAGVQSIVMSAAR